MHAYGILVATSPLVAQLILSRLVSDFLFSPDFLEYFEATAPVLDADPSLFCVSAWNDNGYKGLAMEPMALQRTSYFPGLGWYLSRRLWDDELAAKWPQVGGHTGWDHWLREEAQTKGRECGTLFSISCFLV